MGSCKRAIENACSDHTECTHHCISMTTKAITAWFAGNHGTTCSQSRTRKRNYSGPLKSFSIAPLHLSLPPHWSMADLSVFFELSLACSCRDSHWNTTCIHTIADWYATQKTTVLRSIGICDDIASLYNVKNVLVPLCSVIDSVAKTVARLAWHTCTFVLIWQQLLIEIFHQARHQS